MRGSDRGLLLGDGLFETILVRRGVPFRLDRHLARLRLAAGRTGIPLPAELASAARDRIESGVDLPGEGLHGADRSDADRPGSDRSRVGAPRPTSSARTRPEFAALRITITRGPGDGLAPPTRPVGAMYLSYRAIERPPPSERPGLSAMTVGRVDERALTAGLKHTGYLERILALRAAREVGLDEAVLQNSSGALVEGSASNLFAVQSGTLLTPAVAEGALPGITRQAILELAEVAGVPVEIRAPGPEEPVDELFLTSALRGPVPLVRLDEREFGPPGPIYLRLARDLEAVIGRETATGS
ncbi:MAG: hypothetical protein EA351_05810 [Gemmatimonadales bacterium]|nr:MAG: hypothetical protein EA351_05810 [Gemmatimonadales bacterium]